jgi:hypothetical protein
MAAGAAMLMASGGRNNLAQALGAGGLAALGSRGRSADAARDDMVAGYQMEQLQRKNAQERALEQALPELIKAQFAPEAVAGAVQRAPGAALPILDMVDKRNKAKLEQTKIEADIQDKRLKIAEKFANQAAYLAKGTPTPQQVQKFAQSLEANGVQGILGQVPFQSWANPDEAKSNLSAMASMFYDIKDRMTQEETGRHNLTTEGQTAARDAASKANQEAQLQVSRGNLGVAQANANALRPQMVGDAMYLFDRAGNAKPATLGGQPIKAAPQVSETTLQKLAQNETALAEIQRARQLVNDNPEALGLKNFLPELAMQRIDPSGVDTRSVVGKIGAQKIHDLSGAAVTVSEFPRLAVFIPSARDTPEAAQIKLNNLERELTQVQSELAMGKSLATMIRERTAAGAVSPIGQAPAGQAAAPPPGYDQLKPGDTYVGPDGKTRRKR